MLAGHADRSLLEQYSIFASFVVSLALKTLQRSLNSPLVQLKNRLERNNCYFQL